MYLIVMNIVFLAYKENFAELMRRMKAAERATQVQNKNKAIRRAAAQDRRDFLNSEEKEIDFYFGIHH